VHGEVELDSLCETNFWLMSKGDMQITTITVSFLTTTMDSGISTTLLDQNLEGCYLGVEDCQIGHQGRV
jgi:hypothetical protein